jgi:hypothetical protein
MRFTLRSLEQRLKKLAQNRPPPSINWDDLATGDGEAFYLSLPEKLKESAREAMASEGLGADEIEAEIAALSQSPPTGDGQDVNDNG